jgi:phosphoglycerate dehydrogenase-like enzyme
MKICASSDLLAHFGSALTQIAPLAELVSIDFDGKFDGDPDGIEVLVFSSAAGIDRNVMRSLVPHFGSPTLRWMQSPGAGVEHPAFGALIERGIRLTNGSGLHAEPIAQYIFTYVLHWERQVARHQAQQAARQWNLLVSEDLTSKTLGIVGLGGIGEAAARIGRAFGMRVIGMRRSPIESPFVDLHLPPEELHALLAQSDYVVLSLPLTDASRHLIGVAEFETMGADAVLINVARGGVVDEPALIEALRSGTIRGATLDVVATEPLPEESPLWSLPNCIITPHDAGWSPRACERIAALFLDNLGRYVRGDPMRNEIHAAEFAGNRGVGEGG